MICRYKCLICWFFCLSLANFAEAADPNVNRPPNVIVIVSDDQGYRDLGCFGSPDIKTPHLDRLADGGVRLTSFYVAWPACTPSRAALLTGRYPQRNGTYDMIRNDLVDFGHQYSPAEYAVSPERILGTDVREIFISNILKDQGYVCGCFGKWDGGQLKRFLPLARGFDDFYGFCNTGIDYYTHERYGIPSMWRGNMPTVEDKGKYATDLFRREAIRFVHEHHDRPFFIYLPFNAPHSSSNLDREIRSTIQAPPEYLAKYPAGETKKEKSRQHYMAAVTCMDDAIGELLDTLDKYNLSDNTLIIFFSDNGGGGGSDNAPLSASKGSMCEGGIRVPAIVRFPGRIPAGTVSDEFLTSLEVLPTAAQAAGAKLPAATLDGFDMLPVLSGKSPSPRKEMYWEARENRATRVGQWKWVKMGAREGLYDLSRDIAEQHDLSAERPEVLAMLRGRFATWREEMNRSEPRGPFRDY